MVLGGAESIGLYGGDIRSGFTLEYGSFAADMRDGEVGRHIVPLFFQGLVTYGQDLRLRANLCESWEQNEDATRFVYHLRKGLKWSDGAPLTSADARFYHDHVASDPDLAIMAPGADPEGSELLTPDSFTLEYHLARPRPFHPHEMAHRLPLLPAHYLERWHGAFTDPALLAEAVKESPARTWKGLFTLQGNCAYNPDLPVTRTWVLASDPRGERVILARNPYAFQVDAEGHQLPYLDHLVLVRYDAADALREAVLRADVDVQAYPLGPDDASTFEAATPTDPWRLLGLPSSWHLTMELNVAYQEEPLRTFFGERGVREALMLGIDRQRINVLCYDGRCTPRQYSPIPESPWYDEGLSTAHVAYDPGRAGELLDEAGYGRLDAGGWRTDAEGRRISFRLAIVAATEGTLAMAARELCADLADLGIECLVEQLDRLGFVRRAAANRIEAVLTEREGMLMPIVSEYRRLFRTVGDYRDQWAGGYLYHRLYGDAPGDVVAIEPPADHWIRELWSLWDQIAVSPDAAGRNALYARVQALWQQEIPLIGIVGCAPRPCVVARGLHNLREDLPYDLETGGLGLQHPQTFYWERPEQHAVVTPEPTRPAAD